MSDDVDITNERMDAELQQLISAARRVVPPGNAGVCSECDEYTPRLIKGKCAPCRDMLERISRNQHYSEE